MNDESTVDAGPDRAQPSRGTGRQPIPDTAGAAKATPVSPVVDQSASGPASIGEAEPRNDDPVCSDCGADLPASGRCEWGCTDVHLDRIEARRLRHLDARPDHVRRAEDAAWRENEAHERARI
jgi:hypothetical protein